MTQPCATAQLRSIASGIGLGGHLPAGLNYRVAEFHLLPVTVIVKDGEVVHIGYSLFTPWQRQHLPGDQCNFIERLALTSDLGAIQRMAELSDGIVVWGGEAAVSAVRSAAFAAAEEEDSRRCLSGKAYGKRFSLWSVPGRRSCCPLPVPFPLREAMSLREIRSCAAM